MDTIGSRIKKLREAKGYSMGKLEEAIEASRGSVNQWEKDRNVPGGKAVISLAKFFNVSTDYILLGVEMNKQNDYDFLFEKCELNSQINQFQEEDMRELQNFTDYLLYKRRQNKEMNTSEAGILPSEQFIKLPILSDILDVDPLYALQNYYDFLEVPLSISKGGDFIIHVKGDSMMNAGICDGDYVIVKKQFQAKAGEIVVTTIDQEPAIKTLKYINEHSYVFEAANPNYAAITIPNAVIYGIVIGVYRNNKHS